MRKLLRVCEPFLLVALAVLPWYAVAVCGLVGELCH